MKLSTQLIHAGELDPRPLGAVAMPVFQSANFETRNAREYGSEVYARLNNTPNHQVLHAKLAQIEETEEALVTSSGMAAISSAFLGLLKTGDHVLAQQTLYGGTHSLLTEDLKRFGITCDFIDPVRPQTWENRLKPETKVIYVEGISNPLMEVPELDAVVAFARQHSLVSMIDNTFASPVNFRPARLGFDLVLHSATKYLNGHSDIVAGAIAGRRNLLAPIRHTLTHLGSTLDPHACFLLHRGLKTLEVRVVRQNETGLKVAQALALHPQVTGLNYPGLEGHSSYARAKRFFSGFGGMLSFELKGGASAVDRFLSRLRLPINAASLGGVESLVVLPARSSHLGLTPEERKAAGISESLVRLSVGLEDAQDLIDDLKQALGD